MNYFDSNKVYWEKGYPAVNVDHPVFRFTGRILHVDFPHLRGCRAVDFGCGQGAAVNYFLMHGYDAVGVDISETDIGAARIRYPHAAHRFLICDPNPRQVPFYGFEQDIGLVTAIQSLYYFRDDDFAVCIEKLHRSMKPGGVFFATLMGTRCAEFYDNSEDVGGGLRRVNFRNDRLNVENYYMSFIKDEDDLKQRFSMFSPVHIGFYAVRLRNDEGDGFHYTFCGTKK